MVKRLAATSEPRYSIGLELPVLAVSAIVYGNAPAKNPTPDINPSPKPPINREGALPPNVLVQPL